MGLGVGSVDALAYLGPRPRALAAGDLMVDRSFRLTRCITSAARSGLDVSKVPGHANERVVSIARIERATAERIAQGWLIITGGEGTPQQQLLLSRLTGHVVSAAHRVRLR